METETFLRQYEVIFIIGLHIPNVHYKNVVIIIPGINPITIFILNIWLVRIEWTKIRIKHHVINNNCIANIEFANLMYISYSSDI